MFINLTFTRKNYPDLRLNEALQAFRNLGCAKVAAADNAVTVMADIISPLNQKQRELLNTYTIIRDIMFQLDDTRKAQAEDFKKYAKILGFNMNDLFHYTNYFRRRVIQYLDVARSGKRTPSARGNLDIQNRYDGEINAIMGHSFFKKRKDTLQDYVTDYVQANAEVRAQLAQDIETMKTLEYIRKNHDIAPRLRKQHGIKSQQLEIDYDGSQSFSQSGNEE